MREIGYYNGKMGNLNEMEIPMQDRALFFGDGVYDVASAWKGTFFALDDHLDRFYRSCSMLEIKFPLTREELKAELQKCLDAAESEEAAAVYWQ
jgi:D-alanine transaminase